MQDKDSLIRFLGFMTLTTSAIAALCLGLLAYTYATGDLPYGIQPILPTIGHDSSFEFPEAAPASPAAPAGGHGAPAGGHGAPAGGHGAPAGGHGGGAAAPVAVAAPPPPVAKPAAGKNTLAQSAAYRSGEYFAQRLFEQLEAERQRLENERLKLAEKEHVLQQLAENETKLKAETDKALAKLDLVLDTITVQEAANAKQLANVIGQAEVSEAMKMLLEMDDKVASRVVFYLPPKRAGELFSAMMKKSEPETSKRAARILENVHRLRQEPNT